MKKIYFILIAVLFMTAANAQIIYPTNNWRPNPNRNFAKYLRLYNGNLQIDKVGNGVTYTDIQGNYKYVVLRLDNHSGAAAAPTVTILDAGTLGGTGTPTVTRSGIGQFLISKTGAFTTDYNKVTVNLLGASADGIPNVNVFAQSSQYYTYNANQIPFRIQTMASGGDTDTYNVVVEFRVYN